MGTHYISTSITLFSPVSTHPVSTTLSSPVSACPVSTPLSPPSPPPSPLEPQGPLPPPNPPAPPLSMYLTDGVVSGMTIVDVQSGSGRRKLQGSANTKNAQVEEGVCESIKKRTDFTCRTNDVNITITGDSLLSMSFRAVDCTASRFPATSIRRHIDEDVRLFTNETYGIEAVNATIGCQQRVVSAPRVPPPSPPPPSPSPPPSPPQASRSCVFLYSRRSV